MHGWLRGGGWALHPCGHGDAPSPQGKLSPHSTVGQGTAYAPQRHQPPSLPHPPRPTVRLRCPRLSGCVISAPGGSHRHPP